MRTFSPYEKNQLVKHGISESTARTYGEMPVEYITGSVPFCSFELSVTPDVLIPRVESEELVAVAVELIEEMFKIRNTSPSEPIRVADVGTGSGALGIGIGRSLAKKGIPFEMTLSDVSSSAVAIAKKNWQHLMKQPAQILTSDLLAQYPADQKFDLLVANLPYIPTARIAVLEPSVTEFEPHLALDGGPEGLSLMEIFLTQAISRLKPGSKIILEIDYTHVKDVLRLNKNYTGYVKNDTFGQPRFAILELAT